MDPIKIAFDKAKSDIQNLQNEINLLKNELNELKKTNQQLISTLQLNELNNLPSKALKSPNLPISIRNEGVPTDRQTNQQTNRHITIEEKQIEKENKTDIISPINRVQTALANLHEASSELKSKFISLTKQELLVYTTIYQLTDLQNTVDYSLISKKLNLTESSIRDYTLKLIKKGIPLIKIKVDNKKITLKIPDEFKKIASLQAIISLSKHDYRQAE